MTSLRVHRHSDQMKPARVAGALVLDAEASWVVEGPTHEIDDVVADLGGVCDRVADTVVLLRFGNAVGRIDRAGSLGALRIHSGKWTERDYDLMLEDLSRITASLPFASTSPSSLPYERTELDARDVLYHAFVWLRHALLCENARELHDAIAGILRDPHRKLTRVGRIVPVELAGRIDGRALEDVASGRWPMTEHELGFAVASRRVLPTHVSERHARESVDTAENRFVRAFLDECAWVVERVRHYIGRGETMFARRVRHDCDRLADTLMTWQRAAFWTEVGVMTHFPNSSSVLQRRHEYRTVLRHHLMLRLGSRVRIDPDTVRRLLESKDIATLYELWATFTVFNEVTAHLGPPSESARLVTNHKGTSVSWGLVARWPDGTALAYNPTYTCSKGFHGRSRSLLVRPDIALFTQYGQDKGLHLFDAKFRLKDSLDAVTSEDDTSARTSDLHKMHAYRDAIPAARSAWVVYPGDADAVYLDDGHRDLTGLTDGSLAGVGALSVQPAGRRSGLTSVVRALVAPSAVRTAMAD